MSLLLKGGRGVKTYNLCPYFLCPIQGRGGGGKRRMGKCPLLGNFFFWKASLSGYKSIGLREWELGLSTYLLVQPMTP